MVGTPRSKLKTVEKELLQDGWMRVRDEVEAKLVPMPSGTETYVLCRSTARREKERAIRRRFSTRIERALKNLAQQVEQGQLKDRSKIEGRLGKIQARHPHVADLYTMGITEREGRLAVDWRALAERRTWREAREGAYLRHSECSPARALELLATLKSADIVLPTADGRELRLRRITEPTPEQKRLLQQLKISLPEHLNFELKCSENSAIA